MANKTFSLQALSEIPRSFYGMSLAHIGVAVFIVGISLTSIYSVEEDVRMAPQDKYKLGNYRFEFLGTKSIQGVNYNAQQGRFIVTKDNQVVTAMFPEKRIYRVQRNAMTEAAIDAGLSRDLFVALGERRGSDGAWSIRIYIKPFIRWIWFGAVIMALGGFIAVTDKRYRVMALKDKTSSDKSEGVA